MEYIEKKVEKLLGDYAREKCDITEELERMISAAETGEREFIWGAFRDESAVFFGFWNERLSLIDGNLENSLYREICSSPNPLLFVIRLDTSDRYTERSLIGDVFVYDPEDYMSLLDAHTVTPFAIEHECADGYKTLFPVGVSDDFIESVDSMHGGRNSDRAWKTPRLIVKDMNALDAALDSLRKERLKTGKKI